MASSEARSWKQGRGVAVAMVGTLALGKYTVTLRLGLTRQFPTEIPEIAVEKVEPEIELPHIDADGKLCYQAEDGLLLDRLRPQAILGEALELSRGVLQKGITGNRSEAFLDEIIAYWKRIEPKRSQSICGAVTLDDEARKIDAVFTTKKELLAVADSQEALRKSISGRSLKALSFRRAAYLPIQIDTSRPFTPKMLTELSTLRTLLFDDCTSREKKKRRKILEKSTSKEAVVILGVRRPCGKRAAVGLWYRGHDQHPLLGGESIADPVLLRINRRDRTYLVPRGGANAALCKKRVLLLGCGAVGGHVALALARTGIGRLTFLDKDEFEPANTFRHACGIAHDGQPKASSLAKEVQRLIPQVDVESKTGEVLELLERDRKLLRDADLVISALGAPTIELNLNEHLWQLGRPPAVFTWMEPLGIGGHVLVTHPSKGSDRRPGCLQCIYPPSRVAEDPENTAAFAMEGIDYTQDELGCGSRHLPFADLQAQQVAILTTRAAVQVLRGDGLDPRLLSWKGDSSAFQAAGYETKPRYSLTQDQLNDRALHFARSDCPICRN